MGSVKLKSFIVWISVVTVSLLIIFFGSRYAMKGLKLFTNGADESVRGTVTSVVKTTKATSNIGEGLDSKDTSTTFLCKLKTGTFKGKTVTAVQNQSSSYGGSDKIKRVEKGDDVIVTHISRNISNTGTRAMLGMSENSVLNSAAGANDASKLEWTFVDYYRLNKILALATVFAVLLVIIGLKKGINALVSLVFTGAFVFSIFIPWILNGYNIYVGIVITATFTIVMSLLLIEGASKKSLVTILGCFAGTAMSAFITWVMNLFLHLTGFVTENSIYITMLNSERPINLIGIVFAGIVIGALGAIMDVAMDISSALNEIVSHVPNISFKEMFKSGMNIGHDIMGTMANTLVLAYIGGALSDIMLLFTYSASIMELLNKEKVIIEMLQAIAGSISIILTVPFTVILAGIIYLHGRSNDVATEATEPALVPDSTEAKRITPPKSKEDKYIPKH